MRQVLILLVLTLAAVLQAAEAADACGDKFLLVGRGARFQRAYAAIYPATILIYAHSQTGLSAAIRDPQLQASLKLAGHRASIVEDEGLFKQALKSGGFDIVLGDVAEAAALETQAQASPSKPTVLSVMYKPTKVEAAELEKQFSCKLKASDRAERYLSVIDDTMRARMKGTPAKKSS